MRHLYREECRDCLRLRPHSGGNVRLGKHNRASVRLARAGAHPKMFYIAEGQPVERLCPYEVPIMTLPERELRGQLLWKQAGDVPLEAQGPWLTPSISRGWRVRLNRPRRGGNEAVSVIPDMIQPIEGWKTWSLVGDKLESPSFLVGWSWRTRTCCLCRWQF